MEELIFATGNQHKMSELTEMLKHYPIKLKSLKDISWIGDIEETGNTLEENSALKARTIYNSLNENVFAEDTGLEVYALSMAPGVHTARYAGPQKSADDNMKKLLLSLEGINNRRARFRTVITLIWDNQEYVFEGICDGTIADKSSGTGGFGYDPIFIPENYNQTFGELSDEVKNKISHRYRALVKMLEFFDRKETK